MIVLMLNVECCYLSFAVIMTDGGDETVKLVKTAHKLWGIFRAYYFYITYFIYCIRLFIYA